MSNNCRDSASPPTAIRLAGILERDALEVEALDQAP
jgi:hypothetical protein